MSASTTFVRPDLTASMRINFVVFVTYSSIVIADLIAFIGAGALAVMLRYMFHGEFTPADYLNFTPSAIIFFIVFVISGLYPGLAISPVEESGRILRASSIVFLLIIGATVFLREGLLSSRLVFILAWLFTILFVPLSRQVMRGWCSRQSWWGIPTVILGDAHAGLMMLRLLEQHPRLGLRTVALLTEESTAHSLGPQQDRPIFFGPLSSSASFARDYVNCYAIIAMPHSGAERMKAIFNEYVDLYKRVLIIPDLFGVCSLSVSAKDLCGILTLEVNQKLTRGLSQLVKRSFDLALCITLGLLACPLLGIIYLAVKLTSPGPALYGHSRVGRNNKHFKAWKFRSMVNEADAILQQNLEADPRLREEWDTYHKLRRDPRVTPIGRFLRKTSLDELPQLWNVIRGEMSLVGPRPIVHSEIIKYGQIYRQYLRVTPGMTGLWQISGRNNTTYEMRTRLDDYYVTNWSVSLDIYILARTLKTVLLLEGAY
jgi:Undecaprenyl-phosphate galactose phosphotransferase WbaP